MVTPAFHPQVGGVERHVLKLSQALAASGADVLVVAKGTGAPQETSVDGLRVLRGPWRGPGAWRFRRSVREEVRGRIVHCHDFEAAQWARGLRAPRPRRFVTFHGHEGEWPIPRRYLRIRARVERWAAGNICIGSYIPRFYGTRPDRVLVGGVDAVADGGTGRPGRLLFLGRVANDTDPLMLAGALALLDPAERKRVDLHVCGDGPLRPAMESQVQGTFHGFVADPAPHIRQARAIVVPGYLAALEAAANGRVAIATHATPLKQAYWADFRGEPWFLEAGDPQALADCLRRAEALAAEPRIAAAARAFASQRTWQAVAAAYRLLWEQGGAP